MRGICFLIPVLFFSLLNGAYLVPRSSLPRGARSDLVPRATGSASAAHSCSPLLSYSELYQSGDGGVRRICCFPGERGAAFTLTVYSSVICGNDSNRYKPISSTETIVVVATIYFRTPSFSVARNTLSECLPVLLVCLYNGSVGAFRDTRRAVCTVQGRDEGSVSWIGQQWNCVLTFCLAAPCTIELISQVTARRLCMLQYDERGLHARLWPLSHGRIGGRSRSDAVFLAWFN